MQRITTRQNINKTAIFKKLARFMLLIPVKSFWGETNKKI